MANKFRTWEQAVQWLREQPDQQALVRDAYYDDPLPEVANRYWLSEEWCAIRQYMQIARSSALDVGAGRGIASYALAKEGFAEVVALEPDPSALVGAAAIRFLAGEAMLPIKVTEEFSELLPYEDNVFDIVFARAVLHHTQNLKTACSEFYRVLKPGGRLIAVREHVISKKEDIHLFFDIHPLHKLYGGENAFLIKDYQQAIIGAGFHELITLSPFDCAINFAPYTLETIQSKIAERITKDIPILTIFTRKVITIFWPIIRLILNKMDRRPGRLYSFVASKG